MAKPSQQRWREANANKAVRDGLEKVAQRLANRAASLSRSEGGTASYSLRRGIREGGRAYVDVVSSSRDEEFGTEDTKRIGALRRAARGG